MSKHYECDVCSSPIEPPAGSATQAWLLRSGRDFLVFAAWDVVTNPQSVYLTERNIHLCSFACVEKMISKFIAKERERAGSYSIAKIFVPGDRPAEVIEAEKK